MGKIINLNKNNDFSKSDIWRKIEEESAQENVDEKKRSNTRKKHLHYLLILILCLLILDALGWISIKTNFVGIAGIATKILSYFPKMNST